MKEDQITNAIIGKSIEIHRILGPGLLESVYEKVLAHELEKSGFKVEVQKGIPLIYEGLHIETAFRADLIVNDAIVVELKSIAEVEKIHFKQLSTYLRLAKIRVGLLINFNEIYLKDGLKRMVNGYRADGKDRT